MCPVYCELCRGLWGKQEIITSQQSVFVVGIGKTYSGFQMGSLKLSTECKDNFIMKFGIYEHVGWK
jgi:hypothetical protein